MRDRHWDTSAHSRRSSQSLSQTQPELRWLHIPGLLPLLSEYMSRKEQESLCSAQSTDHILQGVSKEELNHQVCSLYTPVWPTLLSHTFPPSSPSPFPSHRFSHPRAGSSQEFSHRFLKQRREQSENSCSHTSAALQTLLFSCP